MSKIGLRVGVPEVLDSMEPIELVDESTNLKAAFVERYAVDSLPAEWYRDVQGFYVLLSHINPDNTFMAYVGKTDSSFARRLRSHLETKDFWALAVLFKKNGPEGFTMNQTSYLEGIMVDALSSSPNVKVTNSAPTGDRNFLDWNKRYMDSVQLAALRILFLRGYRNSHMGGITRQLETVTALPETPMHASTVIEVPRLSPPPVFDKAVFQRLRSIAQEIRDSDPATVRSYKYWASDNNLRVIVDANPQTLEELQVIRLTQAWQIDPYKKRADDIVALFTQPRS